MRLIPWRRRTPCSEVEEARRAREQAEADLRATRAETEHYRQLGRSLARVAERNHLAEGIARALREGRA